MGHNSNPYLHKAEQNKNIRIQFLAHQREDAGQLIDYYGAFPANTTCPFWFVTTISKIQLCTEHMLRRGGGTGKGKTGSGFPETTHDHGK